MNKVDRIFKDISEKSVCYKSNVELMELSEKELDELLDRLYGLWFDTRKRLDEQIVVNVKFSSNFFIYEAQEAEAKAKYLYVKAYKMMKNY